MSRGACRRSAGAGVVLDVKEVRRIEDRSLAAFVELVDEVEVERTVVNVAAGVILAGEADRVRVGGREQYLLRKEPGLSDGWGAEVVVGRGEPACA